MIPNWWIYIQVVDIGVQPPGGQLPVVRHQRGPDPRHGQEQEEGGQAPGLRPRPLPLQRSPAPQPSRRAGGSPQQGKSLF